MGRTSLAIELIEMIRVGTARKDDILANLEQGGAGADELRRASAPRVTVTLHELRPPTAPRHHRAQLSQRAHIAHGTSVIGDDYTNGAYAAVASIALHDLSASGRLDVARIGRLPDQDLQILDPLVSREHGLVILAADTVLYCDYGTMRTGSMNGTYVDGVMLVRDAMITWLPLHDLMLGRFLYTSSRAPRSWFKLSVQYVDDPAVN